MVSRICLLLGVCSGWLVAPWSVSQAAPKVFRVGTAKVDITPTKFPVIVNCGFLENSAVRANSPLHARALVLDDGQRRIALVIVDSCMMPRELIDEAKMQASQDTGSPTERMLIAVTHTHTAPAAMPCLGSRVDELYSRGLPALLARAIVEANRQLRPAQVGFTRVAAWEFTHCRRWITRPDTIQLDPFGERTVRAMMHPGYENPNYVAPSGPVDPDLSLLAFRSAEGTPLAVLANFSMHYFGTSPVSADYFGLFAERLGPAIGAGDTAIPFVGIMSQGTSGDSHWMDYSKPQRSIRMSEYADGLVRVAAQALSKVVYRDWVPLDMVERKLTLQRRVPDAKRLAWAKSIVAAMGDRLPKDRQEIYAREQLELAAQPQRELKLQALRIGEVGITAIPNEVFAITGLKLKAQSPFEQTFHIALANGAEGYIPPPEQHRLGGYTTWPARTASLESEAEPKIVETLLQLLEQVSQKKRRPWSVPLGPYAQAVLQAKPVAYWRLEEASGTTARDAVRQETATFEPGFAWYLPGAQAHAEAISAIPEQPSAFTGSVINRGVHFAGGRLTAQLPNIGSTYSVELWFWNGLPLQLRSVTGYLFSRGKADAAIGDHLGLMGNAQPQSAGRLFFSTGPMHQAVCLGQTVIPLRTWNQVVLVREGRKVALYLNGQREASGESDPAPAEPTWFLGNRSDRAAGFEGKLDEWAIYDRALTADEVAAHYRLVRPQR